MNTIESGELRFGDENDRSKFANVFADFFYSLIDVYSRENDVVMRLTEIYFSSKNNWKYDFVDRTEVSYWPSLEYLMTSISVAKCPCTAS